MLTAATNPVRPTDGSLAALLESRDSLTDPEWEDRLVSWLKVQESSIRGLSPEDPRRKRMLRRRRIAQRLLNRTRLSRPADGLSRERVA